MSVSGQTGAAKFTALRHRRMKLYCIYFIYLSMQIGEKLPGCEFENGSHACNNQSLQRTTGLQEAVDVSLSPP